MDQFIEKWGLSVPFREQDIEFIFKEGNRVIVLFNSELKEIYEQTLHTGYKIPVCNGCSGKVVKMLNQLHDASN